MPRPYWPDSPFRYFNRSPEIIRLVVMMSVRFPLGLRNVEDLLFERGIEICHETVRLWWNRLGLLFAGDIRRQRFSRMKGFRRGNGTSMRCKLLVRFQERAVLPVMAAIGWKSEWTLSG